MLHDRVKDFRFEIVGITNITGDHLNIHKTFENYVDCKKKLISLVKENGYVVLNGDDPILHEIEGNNIIKFGFNGDNDYYIKDVDYKGKETIINVQYKDEMFTINSPLKAKYNVYNVVMAFIICRLFGLDDNKCCDGFYYL